MLNKRISKDLVYNYISVGITAMCGAAFSIIISYFYPEDILGRFNTIYSYYIVLSQFCVCGIHMAVVKYAAEDAENTGSIYLLFRAAVLSLSSSLIISIVGWAVVNCVFCSYIGESMVRSLNTIWIALVFFSINKVFLGWLNGNSMMKAYAFFQASRNFIIALSLILFSFSGLSGEELTYCFLAAESVLFIFEVIYLFGNCRQKKCEKRTASYRELLWFGMRILPSNAVLELNTKIDVICLSFFAGDETLVGIYSFAAMFGEGFYQLFVVIRKVINPNIAKIYIMNGIDDYVHEFKNKYMKWIYGLSAIGALVLLCGFCVIVYLIGKDGYLCGLLPLTVLCSAIVLNAKAIVFGNILAQTGNPAEESIVNIVTTLCNGLLNVILILHFGIMGAAAATGISYCIYSIVQRYFVKMKVSKTV